tara:strand:+ start:206 stop:520 length:315 start_codon:yes stop_codon:yes gene_type:complete
LIQKYILNVNKYVKFIFDKILLIIKKISKDLKTSKCWVWFRGNLEGNGFWKEGFTCTFDEKPGILIESPAFVSCRVPNWRVVTTEPDDFSQGPNIPDKAIWKII